MRTHIDPVDTRLFPLLSTKNQTIKFTATSEAETHLQWSRKLQVSARVIKVKTDYTTGIYHFRFGCNGCILTKEHSLETAVQADCFLWQKGRDDNVNS